MKKNTQRLLEKVTRKRRYRHGKLRLVKKSSKKGFKIVGGKEKKMKAAERLKRSRSARKVARKGKAHRGAAVARRTRFTKKTMRRLGKR